MSNDNTYHRFPRFFQIPGRFMSHRIVRSANPSSLSAADFILIHLTATDFVLIYPTAAVLWPRPERPSERTFILSKSHSRCGSSRLTRSARSHSTSSR
jgi:hypothetical protein